MFPVSILEPRIANKRVIAIAFTYEMVLNSAIAFGKVAEIVIARTWFTARNRSYTIRTVGNAGASPVFAFREFWLRTLPLTLLAFPQFQPTFNLEHRCCCILGRIAVAVRLLEWLEGQRKSLFTARSERTAPSLERSHPPHNF
ncbi:hypothetical protein [Nostoc sp. FACHB-110]|uniref:hypothetical protein n=1 Tax=Nostoc sp. FACHB-110 TaxID=2692834 RepID=UPI0016837CEA|nr:hypothetical protein [Nostoc sp. FACHB-110]MBD2437345.1 hypothetical protein [Nostoc sp. FACHB-110]